MKTFKDIKIGDTVYVYCSSGPVQRFTVTYIEKFDTNNPQNLYCIGYGYFGSKPKLYQDSIQSRCRLNDTSSTFGLFAATVYFNQEDVIKRFNEDIKTLERHKQEFIKDKGL
jgi:hypothetical protein